MAVRTAIYRTPTGSRIGVRRYGTHAEDPPPMAVLGLQETIGRAACMAAPWVQDAAGQSRRLSRLAATKRAVTRAFPYGAAPGRMARRDRIEAARRGAPNALWLGVSAAPGMGLPNINQAQGFLAARWVTTELLELYVAPDAQRQGLASALVHSALCMLPPESTVVFRAPTRSVPGTWAKEQNMAPVDTIDDIGMLVSGVQIGTYRTDVTTMLAGLATGERAEWLQNPLTLDVER
jgi:GNAT superfamily N-acetyltransferase